MIARSDLDRGNTGIAGKGVGVGEPRCPTGAPDEAHTKHRAYTVDVQQLGIVLVKCLGHLRSDISQGNVEATYVTYQVRCQALAGAFERWMSPLTTKKLQRGAHRSVKELAVDITPWVETWNQDPKPFVWHKTAEEILGFIAPLLQPDQSHHQYRHALTGQDTSSVLWIVASLCHNHLVARARGVLWHWQVRWEKLHAAWKGGS